jgi:hypothetical protein
VVFVCSFKQAKNSTNSGLDHFLPHDLLSVTPCHVIDVMYLKLLAVYLNKLQIGKCSQMKHIPDNIKIKSNELYPGIITVRHVVTGGWGHVVAQLVEALPHKPESRGFDSR